MNLLIGSVVKLCRASYNMLIQCSQQDKELLFAINCV